MLTYGYAVYRGPLLLTRTLTRLLAREIAAKYPGSIVKAETFKGGSL